MIELIIEFIVYVGILIYALFVLAFFAYCGYCTGWQRGNEWTEEQYRKRK